MEYRNLGRSGLKVSTMTLGTMTFGGVNDFSKAGNTDLKEAKEMISMCVDHGINLLDTANLYSFGVSEEIIGQALDGKRPGNMLIATKARMPIGNMPNDSGFSRYHIIRECERSLKRLKTDAIDIYYMHEWDGQTPVEEMLEALDSLVKQGKIRYIGCSNFSGWHIMKALGISDSHHYQRFVTQQIHYTAEAREAEYELLPISVDQGLGVLVWSPLAGGLLTGKYNRNYQPQETTRFTQGWPEPPIYNRERLWNIVDTFTQIANNHGASAAQVGLAWLLTRPAVTSLVIGGRNIAQIKENIAATELKLTVEEINQINEVSAIPMLYPYWHQARWAKDSFSTADKALHGEEQ
jgi:aryl-alcohol dehydrogenase-like predicted oxidoreductase